MLIEAAESRIDPGYWNARTVREVELRSILSFVERNRQFLEGRVLDFGAGKLGTCRQPQPYRELVTGEYVPIDQGDRWPAGRFDAVLCTQVMQYLEDPLAILVRLLGCLRPGGHLVMTYPTNWDEVEVSDLWRFTRSGMELLLKRAGFELLHHDRRATVDLDGCRFPLGYGVVARRPGGAADARSPHAASADGHRREPAHPPIHTLLGIDESAAFLTAKFESREPFLFLRYGDGALECINGLGRGVTADGERYSPELAAKMVQAWYKATGAPGTHVGDWLSASFGSNRSTEYRAEYARLIGDRKLDFLHFEALLLTRTSRELHDFYAAVKADTRRKVYLGPHAHAQAARMLGCEHVITPMKDLLACVDSIYEKLANDPFGFDVLLWAAGMAGTIPVVRLREKFPQRTYINLGSAMDPLNPPLLDGKARPYTRSGQMTKAIALEFLKDLL